MHREPAKGQVTVETAIAISAVVAALVVLAVYARRAYQGYLYANSASHGLQFDLTQSYSEQQSLNSFNQTQDIQVTSGQAAVAAFKGDPRLPSIPGGGLPGRILGTKVKVESSWDVSRNNTYDAQ